MPHTPSRTRRRLLAAAVAWIGQAAWLATAGAQGMPAEPAGVQAAAPPAMLLAREFGPGDDPAHYLVSEKFDGVRAQWDGRTLRFRGGGRVPAPDWFTARLPLQALDGELWLGRGRFDALSGIVRREVPDDGQWRQVKYLVFELPGAGGTFEERVAEIHRLVAEARWPQLVAVEQARVPDRPALRRRLDAVVRAGGEGLMLHRADAPYHTGRSDALLKLKPRQDAEAVVIGHLPGKGRHTGRLGALRLRTPEGVVFQLGTGFTDAQREAPPPVGVLVTYRHHGFTAKGVPRFASFVRVREAF
ncbi:DNA ligase [Aquincola sp. MAHUQ-54]|uniref:DNA ligase n=1 Tax=Aquincola agrisoli TaxID=3119538 RepID=A0AAW9PZP1_9BURK